MTDSQYAVTVVESAENQYVLRHNPCLFFPFALPSQCVCLVSSLIFLEVRVDRKNSFLNKGENYLPIPEYIAGISRAKLHDLGAF